MRAGDLRRRVAIQARTSTQDSWGQQSTSWTDVLANVPAMIEPMSGREREVAAAINAEVDTRITVRYHAALANPVVTASYRVVYVNAGGTRIYNIANVRNIDERNRTIELMAVEGLNEG